MYTNVNELTATDVKTGAKETFPTFELHFPDLDSLLSKDFSHFYYNDCVYRFDKTPELNYMDNELFYDLRGQLSEKDEKIARLNETIDNLEAEVENLSYEISDSIDQELDEEEIEAEDEEEYDTSLPF